MTFTGSFRLAVISAMLLSLVVFNASAFDEGSVPSGSTACFAARTIGIDKNDGNVIRKLGVIELARNVEVDYRDNRRFEPKLLEYRVEYLGVDNSQATPKPEWKLLFTARKLLLRDTDFEVAFELDPMSGLLQPGKYRLRLSLAQGQGVRMMGSCQLLPARVISETVTTPPYIVAGSGPVGSPHRVNEQWRDAIEPIEFQILPKEEGNQERY